MPRTTSAASVTSSRTSLGDPVPRQSASWTGLYVGQVESIGGSHPDGMRFRPESTAKYAEDNERWWAIFWHVVDLRELPKSEWKPVSRMTPLRGKKTYGHPLVPEGPILIQPVG